jgi:AmmeMemoRadiSam system protein A
MSGTDADTGVTEARSAHDGDIAAHTDTLLGLAAASIDHGLVYGQPLDVDPAECPPALQAERASFVTLLGGDGDLRGCTGTIEPHRPLAGEVSDHAFNAAFRDPRFPALTTAERPDVTCKLSVLTPLEPVPFASETDLIAHLSPGIDGVVLESSMGKGTFLPDVWGHLPDPFEFWQALKRKAGLPPGALPRDLRVHRYETITLAHQ